MKEIYSERPSSDSGPNRGKCQQQQYLPVCFATKHPESTCCASISSWNDRLHGQLSHYFPNPVGFGVEEYALPENASIVQLHMLSRHGARYPTEGSGAEVLGKKIHNYTTGVLGNVHFSGPLKFLNSWTYKVRSTYAVEISSLSRELLMLYPAAGCGDSGPRRQAGAL